MCNIPLVLFGVCCAVCVMCTPVGRVAFAVCDGMCCVVCVR